MYEIIVVTNNRDDLSALVKRLKDDPHCTTRWADSVEDAEIHAVGSSRCLMVLDESIAGIPNMTMARQIVLENPMIYLALISPLSDEAFHAASEGLGILTRLPPRPGEKEGSKLLADLRRVLPPEPDPQ